MNTEDFDPKGQQEAQPLSAAALARRRMLLKGLGRGGALLAAAVPLKTLASESICTPEGAGGAPVVRCGISGMTSGPGSRETYTTCSGYSPGWWGQEHDGKPKHWPTGDFCRYDLPYEQVFRREKLRLDGKPPTLFQVMSRSEFANTKTRHWICAWLNAISGGYSQFPYTGQQVLDMYYDVAGTFGSDVAYKFFTTYMETK